MKHIVKPGGQQHKNNFGGNFDIVSEDSSTKCVWEIKAGKFNSSAFYQFYYYLLKGNFDRGYIVGKGLTPEAQKMMDDAINNDGMDIEFIDLSTSRYSYLLS
jgi:predicted RecB family endonuclease